MFDQDVVIVHVIFTRGQQTKVNLTVLRRLVCKCIARCGCGSPVLWTTRPLPVFESIHFLAYC